MLVSNHSQPKIKSPTDVHKGVDSLPENEGGLSRSRPGVASNSMGMGPGSKAGFEILLRSHFPNSCCHSATSRAGGDSRFGRGQVADLLVPACTTCTLAIRSTLKRRRAAGRTRNTSTVLRPARPKRTSRGDRPPACRAGYMHLPRGRPERTPIGRRSLRRSTNLFPSRRMPTTYAGMGPPGRL